jgi:hypothetical protein
MMIKSLVGRGGFAALAIAASGLAIGGIAYASIPDSNGVIHACYNTGANPSGALRVIDTGLNATCSKNEKSLTWNQRGPTGPAGSSGTNGTPGAKGSTGSRGPTGPNGSDATVNGYAAKNTHVIDAADENHEQVLVGLSGLAVGDYMAWSTITNSSGDDAECDLVGASSIEPYDPVTIREGETVGISGVTETGGNGTFGIDLYCWHDPGLVQDNPPTVHATIQALPVSTIQ